MKILELMKLREDVTGCEILDNPFTLSSFVRDRKSGKVLFEGDAIDCQVFLMKLCEKILNADDRDRRSGAA